MSKHEVAVVRLGAIEKHPQADALGLVNLGGYTVVVRLGQFKEGDLAAYIEPDFTVPVNDPRFEFLRPKDKPDRLRQRITVKKLRGIVSHGLLIAAPLGSSEGDNVMEQLGVGRYEPPMPLSTGGETAPPPKMFAPCYDVESARKYVDAFIEGEPVILTEKIHGCSARYVFKDDVMHCGSRTEWKRENETNLWWRALRTTPDLEEWCRKHPDHVVYGEVYGQVQDLKYGHAKGKVSLAAFDVLKPGGVWVNALDFIGGIGSADSRLCAGLPKVPLVSHERWRWPEIAEAASGPSLVSGADNIREGCVIKPEHERIDVRFGRLLLKLVSDVYLERQ